MKILTTKLLVTILLLVVSSCRFQEKMLFYPDKLSNEYQFTFQEKFQEYFFNVDNKNSIHGVLFKADSSKGVVFYLHGNGGAIDSWGNIANVYLKNNYDFFILDYRGYGKSEGRIKNERQINTDLQIVYDSIKTIYKEKNIAIIGYSIGTGFAAKLAADNHPKTLVLKAPYFSMVDLAHKYMKVFPTFLMRYKIKTNENIVKVKCPIVLFHGDKDEVIYFESSEKLMKLLKNGDRLVTLKGQSHNGINENSLYQDELKKILN